MKCKNECGTELTGRKKGFCSDRCRKQYSRKSDKLVSSKSDTVRVEPDFVRVIGVTVYGRQAVRFSGDRFFDTRPAPSEDTDSPHCASRGRYTRQDGTVYQYDIFGTPFEVVDGVVYQDIKDVQVCYAEVV